LIATAVARARMRTRARIPLIGSFRWRTPRSNSCPVSRRRRRRSRRSRAATTAPSRPSNSSNMRRPPEKRAQPIDGADIADCRQHVVKMLRMMGLPIPPDLDGLIIELIGWWHGFELAADVPPPQIDVAPERPRKEPSAPAYDGPPVGWDPWSDGY
jgi:hypothetical protein